MLFLCCAPLFFGFYLRWTLFLEGMDWVIFKFLVYTCHGLDTQQVFIGWTNDAGYLEELSWVIDKLWRYENSTHLSSGIVFIEVIVVYLQVYNLIWVVGNQWTNFRRQEKGLVYIARVFHDLKKDMNKTKAEQSCLPPPLNACQSSDFSSWISKPSVWSHFTWLILYAIACQWILCFKQASFCSVLQTGHTHS